MKIELKRLDNAFHFEARNEEGNVVHLDAAVSAGGHGKGARPMQMLLMALGGCSAIDIVLILKKQKQEIEEFTISIDGERDQGKEPALWQIIHVHYKLKGKINKDKAERAAALSMEKYCSVAKTLEKTAKIDYTVTVN